VSAGNSDEFARFAGAVARELIGDPNKALSTSKELRFGDRGSLSVDLEKGTFFDHKANEGGGLLKLIERETRRGGRDAVEWLREHGFPVEDRDAPHRTSHGPQQSDYKPQRYDIGNNRLPERVPDGGRLTATHDYRAADGALIYQVCRWEWADATTEKGRDKTFVQRRPDPSKKDGWTFSTKGIEQIPYRLPELLEAIKSDEEVFIVEGEKKADMLWALGVPATCNTGGAGKFPETLIQWFRGARVTILPDNDPQSHKPDGSPMFHPDGRPVRPGQDHAEKVGSKLINTAARVRILEVPGLPLKGGVDDWLPAGGSAEELYRLANAISRGVAQAPFESKFGAVMWSELDAPGPAHRWLVKNLLSVGETSMTAGESGSGKTFLVLDMAMCVARGIPFFGRKTTQGGVVYQAGEGARALRRKRLYAYRRHFQCADENVPFTLLERPIDLYSGDDQTDAFIEEVGALGRYLGVPVALVVIDTLSKATPGINENDSADIGKVLERCDRIRRATGAHVMLVHHMNAEGARPRGHTSLLANVETVIVTRKLEDRHDRDGRVLREFELRKQKEGEAGTKTRFVLPVIDIGTDEDGEPVTSCVVATPSGAESGSPTGKPSGIQLGGANQVGLRVLYDLLAGEGTGFFAPPELALPYGARVADRKAWSARFYEISRPEGFDDLADDEKETSRANLRKQFERVRDLLVSKGIIGLDSTTAWATGRPVMGFGPPPGFSTRKPASGPAYAPPDDIPFAE